MAKILTAPLEVSNKRKAAIILALLGPDKAAKVIQYLDESQVEILSLEVARLDRVTANIRIQVVEEFHNMATAQDFISEGGIEEARKILIAAYGEDGASGVIKKIMNAMQVIPFEFLKNADPYQLLSFIQDEHPQTIALILAWLPIHQASTILSKLPTTLRVEIAERIAVMDQTPPEVIKKVEQVLEKKVASVLNQEMAKAGGPKALVELLSKVDRTTERVILENLTETNPDLATTIKNMMFVFEDIIQLDDKSIQQILKETDMKDIGIALKNAKEEVAEKIYKNMSERARGMLKEDMEYMGPMKLKVVEESQQKVVATIRRLEESGEITISRGGDEEEVMV